MYVRKFESDSIDGALKAVKQEFGPDAIILKTVTNKGLKGALRKNKIEITAAISEKNYTKKSRVDTVLDEETKETFYQNNSSYIADMIDGHSDNRDQGSKTNRYEAKLPGYNQMGLNKPVQTSRPDSASALDDFLNATSEKTGVETLRNEKPVEVQSYVERPQAPERSQVLERPRERETQTPGLALEQQAKIDSLEKKVFELTRILERVQQNEPIGVYQIRTTLRSLNINDHYINDIVKKATFELSKQDLEDTDVTFEFALREMLKDISTKMPLFTELKNKDVGTVSIVISDSSCGQTNALYKLAHMCSKSTVIQYCHENEKMFIPDLLDLNVVKASSFAEIISAIRKGIDNRENVFVDFKDLHSDINEAKKFIDGVKRSFAKVEVLICLSSIHSEIYNRRVVNKLSSLADGLIINHLDLCLDYGALFNIAFEHAGLPITFFGTGPVVPDDIEPATGERLLAGMFKLN